MASNPRHVDGGDLAALVDAKSNAAVVAYLTKHQPSCHSDVGDALICSAEKCGEWIAFSPSFQQCRYVALVTNRRVFALGIGQRSVLYLVPASLRATALATGAMAHPEIGANWIGFALFRADWPTPDLAFWTLQAYAAATADRDSPRGA